MLHKEFAQPLNVVIVLKTHLKTQQQGHVILFSSDLTLNHDKLIELYSLRFQIEFNFRDAKQFWGLAVAKADNSVDCDDFNTQTEAQTFYWNKRTSEKLDLAALDHDEDGIACEHLDDSYSLVNRNSYRERRSLLCIIGYKISSCQCKPLYSNSLSVVQLKE